MIIRKATIQDIPNMANIFKRVFSDMDYKNRGYEFNPEHYLNIVKAVIMGSGLFFIAEDDNRHIVGGIGLLLMPSILDMSIRWIEFTWHADPALSPITQGRVMIKLLREVEKNIKGWFTLSTSFDKNISTYLVKKGYRPIENVFLRRI